jgi:transposase
LAVTPGALDALSHDELVSLVLALQARLDALEAENEALKAEAGKNSGNSSKPSSRDPAAERQRQAEQRRAKRQAAAGGKRRRPGKQPGAPGSTLEMSADPDEVIIHAPQRCRGCGGDLADAPVRATARRQVIDVPEIKPKVTEHRAQTRRCPCGTDTAAAFPDGVAARSATAPGSGR